MQEPPIDDATVHDARSKQPRGQRRRESLIQAGTQLLAEQGWHALTSRAVAERAGAPPGLVHYHFGDQAALKQAIAAAVVAEAFSPAIAILTAHDSWEAGIAAVAQAGATMDARQARVSAELFSAAIHDDQVAIVLRHALADARAQLVPWLQTMRSDEAEGLATLITALLDGLVLHRLLDPGLRLDRAAAAATSDLARHHRD